MAKWLIVKIIRIIILENKKWFWITERAENLGFCPGWWLKGCRYKFRPPSSSRQFHSLPLHTLPLSRAPEPSTPTGEALPEPPLRPSRRRARDRHPPPCRPTDLLLRPPPTPVLVDAVTRLSAPPRPVMSTTRFYSCIQCWASKCRGL